MNRVSNQYKDCNLPCNTLTVQLGAENHQHNENKFEATVDFYFSPNVTLITEHFLHTTISFMSDIGMYFGLLLGCSIFQLATIVYKAFGRKISQLEKEINIENH